MSKKITFLTKIIILILFTNTNLYALDLKIVPLKKPGLELKVKEKKLSKNIIKPKEKPKEKLLVTEEAVKQEKADKDKINGILIPKTKPLLAKKQIKKTRTMSKYFKKRDFELAKKAIKEIEKSKWSTALSLTKKTKDKSIYNFIQWKHLLTSGNQASFYDYSLFIDKNPNYPRIGRIKYLAEHKLSTSTISPEKIITWFGQNEPLSGYGNMILGESLISVGNFDKGIYLIKKGWVTAELSRSDLKFFRKKYKKY